MRTFIIGLSLFFLLAQKPVFADDKDKLVGSWKLLSWVMEDDVTKEQKPLYGEHPHGFAIFTPTNRGMFVLTGEGRVKSPQTDTERGAALRSMVAYTGKIRIEGSKFITTVDTAWNETWVGTEQLRNFRIEGDRLYIVAMSQPQPNFDNRLMHGVLMFEREK
jgi:Lipocalin-like domain